MLANPSPGSSLHHHNTHTLLGGLVLVPDLACGLLPTRPLVISTIISRRISSPSTAPQVTGMRWGRVAGSESAGCSALLPVQVRGVNHKS